MPRRLIHFYKYSPLKSRLLVWYHLDKWGEYMDNQGNGSFIAKAFEYAHEADPKALLFYNDYNECQPNKREKIYNITSRSAEEKIGRFFSIKTINRRKRFGNYWMSLVSQLVDYANVAQ